MRKPIIIVLAIFAVGLLVVNGFKTQADDGGNWQDDITWTDASVTADKIEEGGKPVYVFVSTEWCTYCKKMKNETFTDDRVQEFLNERFVNITINPELDGTANFTGEELSYRDLAKKLGVNGYPANFFFAADGTFLGGQPGYLPPESFADIAEYIGGGFYKKYKFNEFLALPADQRL